MKISELRSLIREEVRNIVKEDESLDSTAASDIEKQIVADRLSQQRAFIAWAKSEALKQNMRLDFNGNAMVRVSLSKLERKGILTSELVEKWKAASVGSKENNLYQGLSVLLTTYKLLKLA